MPSFLVGSPAGKRTHALDAQPVSKERDRSLPSKEVPAYFAMLILPFSQGPYVVHSENCSFGHKYSSLSLGEIKKVSD